MKRREFVAGLVGAAAWSLAARAQQPAMPVIGFLHTASPGTNVDRLRGFRQGLQQTGHVEGENVAIEYRWADNQIDRLPALAADLTRRQVAAIVTVARGAFAAKAATTTIPIVFAVAGDPVTVGLVANVARPGGNLTGINFFNTEVSAKRLELLRELVPSAAHVAVLLNPTGPPRYQDHVARHAIGCACHGTANPGAQRQHQPRDQCGILNIRAQPARRPLCRPRPFFPQPAYPIGDPDGAPRSPRDICIA